jgi:hypothetical protein
MFGKPFVDGEKYSERKTETENTNTLVCFSVPLPPSVMHFENKRISNLGSVYCLGTIMSS